MLVHTLKCVTIAPRLELLQGALRVGYRGRAECVSIPYVVFWLARVLLSFTGASAIARWGYQDDF